ncbi:MAG: hypothetical protein K2P30_08445 [Lachnospiraceae bacterium]|nr:hypothetical protein [Lachnospiraceae bacterium]MDE6963640.1 hypothetical protein [Lachnospiraceae bacterium]
MSTLGSFQSIEHITVKIFFITESRCLVESGIKDLREWASEGESKDK